MKRHYFTTCGECGAEEKSESGICPACEVTHGYRDSDAMQARRHEVAEPRSGGSAGRQASPERI